MRRLLGIVLLIAIALTGCAPPHALLGSPLATAAIAMSPAAANPAALLQPATLRVVVKWPDRDYKTFRAQAIPTSTNTLVLTVSTASGSIVTQATISRPAGPATQPVVSDVSVPEGQNLTVAIDAYRQSAPVPAGAQPIASGTAAGINAVAGKLVSVPITLTATFAPTLTGLSVSGSPTGYVLTITGTNFGASTGVTYDVRFSSATSLATDSVSGVPTDAATRSSDSTIQADVPALARTGPIEVIADGIPSAQGTVYWVMGSSPNLLVSANSNYASTVLQVGASEQLNVEETIPFVYPTGMSASNFGAPPSRSYNIADTTIASVSVQPSTLVDTLSGLKNGSTTITAQVGSVLSNQLAVTVAGTWTISTIAGNGEVGSANLGDGGSAATAALAQPSGVAVAPDGSVLVTDAGHARVRKLTTVAATLAGSGTIGQQDGSATAAEFSSGMAQLATDASGDAFVADGGNNTLREITPSGTVTTLAGNGTQGDTGNGNPGNIAELNDPQGVAVDATG
ncbi:MAG: hypothetical protein KGR26_11555, partial [Cyanobacteria bacterium REEB65]|nr:hypothetical protein [Cyanobacteria bacterium REEB65]